MTLIFAFKLGDLNTGTGIDRTAPAHFLPNSYLEEPAKVKIFKTSILVKKTIKRRHRTHTSLS